MRSNPGYVASRRARPAAIVLLGLLIAVSLPMSQAEAAGWPSVFHAYGRFDGTAFADPIDQPAGNAIADLSRGPGATAAEWLPSTYVAADGTDLLIRYRLKTTPGGAGVGGWDTAKGGLNGFAYVVEIGVAGQHVASVGLDGTSASADYVYVAPVEAIVTGGVEYTAARPKVVSTWNGTEIPGARLTNAATPGAAAETFLDFRVPLSDITLVAPSITATTPLQFFFGTSAAASLTTINKDYMSNAGTTCAVVGCAEVIIGPSRIGLTWKDSPTSVSGLHPPKVGAESVYDLTVTANNTGLNELSSIEVVDDLPAGVSVVSATTASGSASVTGQHVQWLPQSLAPGEKVTLTLRVSVQPGAGSAGGSLQLSPGPTASASDVVSGTPSTASLTPVHVGPVAAGEPGSEPTEQPTATPTTDPTPLPTVEPTAPATVAPTDPPTLTPTDPPTAPPTQAPTDGPTAPPTDAATEPASEPTELVDEPTAPPTAATTEDPTEPAGEPTDGPSGTPTEAVSESAEEPTEDPTDSVGEPTEDPTESTPEPTEDPTELIDEPTEDPFEPIDEPTEDPTDSTDPSDPVPVVVDDAAGGRTGEAVTVDVLANDSAPSSLLEPWTVTPVTPLSHGAILAVDAGTGAVTYRPDPGYEGLDGFTYRVCNAHGRCDTANVSTATPPVDLEVVVTRSGPPVHVGDTATYAITVTNLGPRIADAPLTLTLSTSNLSQTHASGDGWIPTLGASPFTAAWSRAAPRVLGSDPLSLQLPTDLAINRPTVVKLVGTVTGAAGSQVRVDAEVAGPTIELEYANNESSARDTVLAEPGDPTDPTDATDPEDPTDPREPDDSNDPADPDHPSDPIAPTGNEPTPNDGTDSGSDPRDPRPPFVQRTLAATGVQTLGMLVAALGLVAAGLGLRRKTRVKPELWLV